MTSIMKSLVCVGIALGAFAGGIGVRAAQASCSQTTPLTYYNGYVDRYDGQQNVYIVFWGYATYGDPQSFQNAAVAEFNTNSPLASFGIGATRFYGVPTQYSGYDWNSGAFGPITPTPGAYWVVDEAGLPAPDAQGKIHLTDTDIGVEADRIANIFGFSYDDILVIFPPPNALPPISNACGQHFISSQDTITAWVAYPQSGCPFTYQQQTIQHEVTEAVTDVAWPNGLSWEGWDQAPGGAACEISDICYLSSYIVETQPGVFTHTQTELSNEAIAAGKNGCVYGRGTTAYVVGLSGGNLFSSTVAADTSLSITNGFSWGAPSGVTLTGGPAVTSWGKDHLDVFVRGTNNKMYHATSETGGNTVGWEALTSTANFTQSPDAATWGAGNVQVFGVQGTNIVKKTKTYGSAWSAWTSVNKPTNVNPSSKVSVVAWGATNTASAFPTDVHTILAAFRGSDGKVWVGNSTGGNFTWKSFTAPATLTGDVDISAWAPPRFDLFVLDTSGNLWDMVSTDGTTVSKSVKFGHPSAGGFQVGPGVSGLGDGRLLLGGRVGSNTPYVQFWNWQAGTWASLGFAYTSPIDIAAP